MLHKTHTYERHLHWEKFIPSIHSKLVCHRISHYSSTNPASCYASLLFIRCHIKCVHFKSMSLCFYAFKKNIRQHQSLLGSEQPHVITVCGGSYGRGKYDCRKSFVGNLKNWQYNK